jgi:prophage tail gpP-like protein
VPSSFDILATERNPDSGAIALLPPASPCTVMIGSDPISTGYVDRYRRSIGPRRHQVQIQGRGKCEDLVDCSITTDILNGMQITASTLMALATTICRHFGAPTPIKAKSPSGNNFPVTSPNGGAPLTFNANLLETPFEILGKTARYAAALFYEDTDGNLVLGAVGDGGTMASGFAQGVNVQNAEVVFAMDERFSVYRPMLMSTNMFGQQGIGGQVFPPVFDQGVPRFRPLITVY